MGDLATETCASRGAIGRSHRGRAPGAHRGTAIWPSTTQTVFRERRRRAGSGEIEGVETQGGGASDQPRRCVVTDGGLAPRRRSAAHA